jgi:DNA polymerase IV
VGRSADIPRAPGVGEGDDTGCTILHVDMDAFFASVEIRRRPELRGRPVAVGGLTRGVVAAASYEARRFGVRSAMSTARALRLCPNLIVLAPDRSAYSAASADVMAILRSVTPLVEPLSLDEAFLDVSGARRLLGRPAVLAASIRGQVAASLGLTCSVGVATTKFVAKLASARCKPDGLLVVPAAGVLEFLHPLPVTVLWGVGERTAVPLHRLGVRTVGDLADTPTDTLRRAVGIAAADHLAALAGGRDARQVRIREVEKSISSDRTFDVDLTSDTEVERELFRLAGEVSGRLRSREFASRTVGIKVRYADFRTVTRVRTLAGWTDSTATVYRATVELYRGLRLDRPRIRLVGVKAENLRAAGQVAEQLTFDEQLTLDDQIPASAAEHAADAARFRFGSGAIGYGSLLSARATAPSHEHSPGTETNPVARKLSRGEIGSYARSSITPNNSHPAGQEKDEEGYGAALRS